MTKPGTNRTVYPNQLKLRFLRFAARYNRRHGRGGIAEACRRFHVPYTTARWWPTSELRNVYRFYLEQDDARKRPNS